MGLGLIDAVKNMFVSKGGSNSKGKGNKRTKKTNKPRKSKRTISSKRTRRAMRGGFVRGGSVQQFVQ